MLGLKLIHVSKRAPDNDWIEVTSGDVIVQDYPDYLELDRPL